MAAFDWLLWTSLAVGGATGHGGPATLGSVGVVKPVASWLAVEGQAGSGGVGNLQDGASLFHLGLGTRIGPQRTDVRPFLWLGLSHAHETAYQAIREDPAGTLLGESSAGVHHRGGVEAGLGVGLPLWSRGDRGALAKSLRTELRVTAIHLPETHEDDPRTYAFGEVALGVTF